MKKFIVRLFHVVAVIIVMLIATVVAAFYLIQTDSIQQRLLSYATNLMSQELQTKVTIDRISLSLADRDVRLYGVMVEDLQQRKMLQVEELGVRMKLRPLLQHHLQLTEARLEGADVLLYKPSPDSVANYQFVIDYFKNRGEKIEEREEEIEEREERREERKVTFDINRVKLERISIDYNNGKIDRRLRASMIDLKNLEELVVDSLCYITDNHQHRRNFGKPKRGFFDANHLNVVASLRLQLTHLSKDSVVAVINACSAEDIGSGIDVRSLVGRVKATKEAIEVDSLNIRLPSTALSMAHVNIQLPDTTKERRLSYSIPQLTGTVVLRDIAHPFAPVLKNFKIPLKLRARVIGNKDAMYFQSVRVATTDKHLTVKASGNLHHLREKHRFGVHFDVQQMKARGGSKERIISQFPVKKFMMKQLHRLGDITYTGHFDVRWREESFVGVLGTTSGKINFRFKINENDKYLMGKVSTQAFELGHVMDMPQLGRIICDADFKFDISKPRTARMRRLKGGKLPIGEVSAEVAEASYKKIKMHHLSATLHSDGALAEGKVTALGKYIDLLCHFSFTNTNEMKKTKIVPGIKFHKKRRDEGGERRDKMEKEKRKEEKKKEKEQKKKEKELKKAQKKKEKEKRREERGERREKK